METLSKEDAINMLQKIISDVETLPTSSKPNDDLSPWNTWCRTTAVRVQRVFGTGSPQIKEIERALAAVGQSTYGWSKSQNAKLVLALIKSMVVEVSELWEDEPSITTEEKPPSGRTQESDKPQQLSQHDAVVNQQVFIVHGHDHGRLQTVARFLERLKLTVIILHERPNEGATIIEKLEAHGNTSFAVILLTPDDIGSVATQPDNLKPRARQNVVLELGYFLGRLGRRRVAALVSEGVELPSDYSGVVYINLDAQGAWQFHLAKELRAAGLPIHGDALL